MYFKGYNSTLRPSSCFKSFDPPAGPLNGLWLSVLRILTVVVSLVLQSGINVAASEVRRMSKLNLISPNPKTVIHRQYGIVNFSEF